MAAHLEISTRHPSSAGIDHRRARIHVRAGFIALATALLLTAAVGLAWTVLPQAAADAQARVVKFSKSKPTTSGWQYPRETARYDFMYAPGAETRDVSSMYARPRSRSYGR